MLILCEAHKFSIYPYWPIIHFLLKSVQTVSGTNKRNFPGRVHDSSLPVGSLLHSPTTAATTYPRIHIYY